jgi:AcrR family transcriptional regulator
MRADAAPSEPAPSATERGRRGAATEARRRQILEAALECFTRRGFDATTMADVREGSGASIGSIYHHFASKEQLAAALYASGLHDYQEGSLAELRAHDDTEQAIKAVVRYHLRWVAANRDLAAFLLQPRQPEVLLASQAEVRELNRRLFGEVGDWLREHSAAVRELPRDVFYTLLIGPSQEFCRHWLAGRTTTPIEEAADSLAQAAWDALKGADER